MTGSRIQSIGLEFQPFLYAEIGDDANGVPLSVISALARRDLDPWDQAARWSRSTRKSAIQELTELIAAAPLAIGARQTGESRQAVPHEIATRLIALLPTMRGSNSDPPAAAPDSASEPAVHPAISRRVVVIIFCVLCGLLGQWLFGALNESSPQDDAQAPHASRTDAHGSQP